MFAAAVVAFLFMFFFFLNKYAEFTGGPPVGQLTETLAAKARGCVYACVFACMSPHLSVNEHTLQQGCEHFSPLLASKTSY